MKTKEELKEEQYDLKAKLHEIIELINSEQYYKFSDSEKSLINQQRVGMELYLSCLTKRIYGTSNADTSNLLWLTMLYGMFSSTTEYSIPNTDNLNTGKDEEKLEGYES